MAEAVRSASVPCEALPRGEPPRKLAKTLPGESPGDVHRSSLLVLLQVLLALLALVLVLVLALQLVLALLALLALLVLLVLVLLLSSTKPSCV